MVDLVDMKRTGHRIASIALASLALATGLGADVLVYDPPASPTTGSMAGKAHS